MFINFLQASNGGLNYLCACKCVCVYVCVCVREREREREKEGEKERERRRETRRGIHLLCILHLSCPFCEDELLLALTFGDTVPQQMSEGE